MKINQLPPHARPREKLAEKGSDALSDAELLAIMLRTGYQGKSALEIAKRILAQHSLSELLNFPLLELSKIKGVGPSRAALLLAAQTLISRSIEIQELASINHPTDVVKTVSSIINKKQEHLVALYLSGRNQVISQNTLCIGTISTNLIHAREVFAPALEYRASKIILAHNHPAGQSYPSEDDIIATEKIVEAGEIMDIPVVDHIIVSTDGWTSMRQEKLL